MAFLRILSELLTYRALASALIRRHVASRYRGSLLGFLWSLMNPLCLMAVYTLVFHHFVKISSGEHYHITLLAGLLPWLWSASAISEGTSSIVASGHLITKSMFPAHLLPFVTLASTLVNFLLSLPILFVFMLIDGATVPLSVLFLPLIILLHGFFLYGIILFVSALNVVFRDVQHIVANALTLLFFLTPIVYPSSVVPERFRVFLLLNPFAALTELYRGTIITGEFPAIFDLSVLGGAAFISCIIGALVYEGLRERFAEVL